MFANMRRPLFLSAAELDKYLANGWFRMRQNIFTTNFLQFNNRFFSVLWLRVTLKKYSESKNYTTLKRLNASFKTEINKANITEAHENLYQAYRQSISFEMTTSLKELLFGYETISRFNTHEINIYDEDTLIASGYFDLGETSAAGISCIYNPAYKKYSLGKYLIYLKIDFCKQHNLKYFYPGYIVPGYKAFDYKARIGTDTLEYLHLASRQWTPYKSFNLPFNPLKIMEDKLELLKIELKKNNILSTVLYYKYFDANLDPDFYENQLFDFPVFLYCYSTKGSFDYHIVVYDVRDEHYHLLQCSTVIYLDHLKNTDNIFSSGLLKLERSLASTSSFSELVNLLPEYL